jgi:hypothetical protein
MPADQHRLTPQDILPTDVYVTARDEHRARLIAMKKNRRVSVGPYATFYFENYETMWQQVQEMVRIEKGGSEQIADELAVYNPLIPQGRELIATLMLEIDDPVARERILKTLAGIEESVYFDFGGTRLKGAPTDYEDRTTPDGKTSSVHWVRFRFPPELVSAFRAQDFGEIVLGLSHPNYRHMAVLAPEVRKALSKDFD